MSGLRERDVRSALDLVYDAGMLTCPEPFPREFLERLTRLIPADVIVGYHEAVIGAPCRTVEVMEIPPDPIPAEVEEAARHIFRQEPFLHGRYRSERRALKTSDVVTRRRFRQTEWYSSVWKPLGIDDSLRVWLPAPVGRARVINLERSGRNFTERERALLEFLRPALIKMHAAASSRRQKRLESPPLTRRETEIVGWIADGKTTREIASILVVSPHTVRKHIEHILEKLDVRTRSAAVARAFPAAVRADPYRARAARQK
jgi:DNA-binding CsgD family transcriptional regulator